VYSLRCLSTSIDEGGNSSFLTRTELILNRITCRRQAGPVASAVLSGARLLAGGHRLRRIESSRRMVGHRGGWCSTGCRDGSGYQLSGGRAEKVARLRAPGHQSRRWRVPQSDEGTRRFRSTQRATLRLRMRFIGSSAFSSSSARSPLRDGAGRRSPRSPGSPRGCLRSRATWAIGLPFSRAGRTALFLESWRKPSAYLCYSTPPLGDVSTLRRGTQTDYSLQRLRRPGKRATMKLYCEKGRQMHCVHRHSVSCRLEGNAVC
jgi:hypothetical protein